MARRRLKKCNESAIKIQSIYRGYVKRKAYKVNKDLHSKKKLLDNSLSKHERNIKKKIEELQKLRQLSNNKYFEYKKENKKKAAILIQSTWRGYYTRKNIDKIKKMNSLASLYDDKDNNNIIDLSYIEGNKTQSLVNDKVWLKKKFEDIHNNIQKYRRDCKKKKYLKEKSPEDKKKVLMERLKDAQKIMDSYYENYFHFFQLKKNIYENRNALEILSINSNYFSFLFINTLKIIFLYITKTLIKNVFPYVYYHTNFLIIIFLLFILL